MFKGDTIQDLVDLLNQRQVMLYHSCQLLDFKSYLKIGGIPSRKLLEGKGLNFTPFKTDKQDQKNDAWDKVFLNLVDFGEMFALGNNAVPTVYGPISLCLSPEVLLNAADVAICLMSAGNPGFCREDLAFSSITDVDRLFNWPISWRSYECRFIKTTTQLKKEFGFDKVSYPEMSCTYLKGYIPLSEILFTIVDPYIINGISLVEKVSEIASSTNIISSDVKTRPTVHNRKMVFSEIGKFIRDTPTLKVVKENKPLWDYSQDFVDWYEKIINTPKMGMQWNNYSPYLRYGTIEHLENSGHLPNEFG